MKQLFIFLALFFTLNFSGHSQSIEGTYERNIGNFFICTLVLKSDSTFTFHYYQKFEESQKFVTPQPEKNIYGKGIWNLEKKILSLHTTKETDIDKTNTLSFTNSKARYSSKSLRDTSNRDVKTALRFYESDISWVTGMELVKLE